MPRRRAIVDAKVNSFKRLTAAFSNNEKDALFHDNAVRFYRLASG